jgi:LysR family glycine cleavage system transcriptional activator
MRMATERLKNEGKRNQLKVRAYTTFAMRWLIPRLSSFHAMHPEVEVVLTTSVEPVDFSKDDLDCAIRLGNGDWPGVNVRRLVSNIIVPVCSPQLLKSGPKLKTPADLRKFQLLHAIARPDDWKEWLTAAGIADGVDYRSGQAYESSAMVYTAAIAGHGVAIAQRFLVEDDLRSGTLVRPFPQSVDRDPFTYYLLTPLQRKESASMKIFLTWLLDQFTESRKPLSRRPRVSSTARNKKN